MTQDLYYYESGYIDNSYFVYTADAESQQSCESTISCDASVIAGGQIQIAYSDMNSFASIACTISHLEGADLFAFTEAALSAQVDRIRSTNTEMATNFSVAVSAVRGIYVQAQADTVASFEVVNSRVRNDQAAIDAAFSLAANCGIVVESQANIDSAFAPSLEASIVKNSFAVLDSVASVSSIANVIRDASSEITSTFTQTSILDSIKLFESNISSNLELSAIGSRVIRVVDPVESTIELPSYTLVNKSSASAKFGTHSLRSSSRDGYTTTYCNDPFTDVAYGNGYLISVKVGVTWRSNDFGDTWTSHVNNLSTLNWGVGYVNDRFWAYGAPAGNYSNPNQLRYSYDGITWTTVTLPSYYAKDKIGYANGLWVTVGALMAGSGGTNRYYVYTSPDLTNWTQRTNFYSYTQVGLPSEPAYFCTLHDIRTSGVNIKFIFSSQTGASSIHGSSNSTGWAQESTLSPLQTGKYQLDVEDDNWIYGASGLTTSTYSVWGSKQGSSAWVKGQQLYSADSGFISRRANKPLLFNGKFIIDQYISSNFGSTWTSYSGANSSRDLWNGKIEKSYLYHFTNTKANFTLSTNTTSFINKKLNLEGFTNLSGYVDYNLTNNSDWNNWNTIDFWVRPEVSGNNTYGTLISKEYSWTIDMLSNGTIEFKDELATMGLGGSGALNTFQWNHVRIVKSASQIAIYVGGTRRGLVTLTSLNSNTSPLTLFGGPGYPSIQDPIGLDAIHITSQQLNDTSLTTITVPTSPPTETANTIGLFNFNDTILEDRLLVTTSRLGQGALTVDATFTSYPIIIVGAQSSLSSQVSTVINPDKFVSLAGDLQSNGFVVAAFGRIRPFVDLEVSSSSLSATATTLLESSATITCTSSIACEVTKNLGPIVVDAQSSTDSFVQADKIAAGQASLEVNASTVSAYGRIRPFVAIEQMSASLDISTNVNKPVGAQLTSNSQLQLVPTKLLGDVTANLQVTAFELVAAVSIPSGGVACQATTNLTANAIRIKALNSQMSALTTLVAESEIVKVYSSNQSSEFTQTASALRIKQLSAGLTVQGAELVAVNKIGNTLVDLQATSSITINATKRTSNSVTLEANTSQTTNATSTKPFSANLQVNAAELIVAEVGLFGRGSFTVTTSMAVSAVKTSAARSSITCNASVVANLTQIKRGISLEASLGTMTTTARRIRSNASAMSSQFAQTTNAKKTVNLSATMQAQGFTMVVGKVINLSASEIYVVPPESNIWMISPETYDWTIQSENRNYIIKE